MASVLADSEFDSFITFGGDETESDHANDFENTQNLITVTLQGSPLQSRQAQGAQASNILNQYFSIDEENEQAQVQMDEFVAARQHNFRQAMIQAQRVIEKGPQAVRRWKMLKSIAPMPHLPCLETHINQLEILLKRVQDAREDGEHDYPLHHECQRVAFQHHQHDNQHNHPYSHPHHDNQPHQHHGHFQHPCQQQQYIADLQRQQQQLHYNYCYNTPAASLPPGGREYASPPAYFQHPYPAPHAKAMIHNCQGFDGYQGIQEPPRGIFQAPITPQAQCFRSVDQYLDPQLSDDFSTSLESPFFIGYDDFDPFNPQSTTWAPTDSLLSSLNTQESQSSNLFTVHSSPLGRSIPSNKGRKRGRNEHEDQSSTLSPKRIKVECDATDQAVFPSRPDAPCSPSPARILSDRSSAESTCKSRASLPMRIHGYPNGNVPLPADVWSNGQIELVKRYPNHLYGSTLKRLVELGWTTNQLSDLAGDPAPDQKRRISRNAMHKRIAKLCGPVRSRQAKSNPSPATEAIGPDIQSINAGSEADVQPLAFNTGSHTDSPGQNSNLNDSSTSQEEFQGLDLDGIDFGIPVEELLSDEALMFLGT